MKDMDQCIGYRVCIEYEDAAYVKTIKSDNPLAIPEPDNSRVVGILDAVSGEYATVVHTYKKRLLFYKRDAGVVIPTSAIKRIWKLKKI